MFWAQYDVLWLIIAALLVVVFLFVRMGVRIFNREELLGNEIDEINLIAVFKAWWSHVLGRRKDVKGRSFLRWYRDELLGLIPKMWPAIAAIAVALGAAFYVGTRYAQIYAIPVEGFVTEDWFERFQFALSNAGLVGLDGVLWVAWQNIRVLAVASVLAVFSFGVLAIMLLMIPLGLVGYLSGNMIAAGIPPLAAWAAILPHSVFEIPAAIIAGAAALRLGASLIAPPPGKTVGQAWIEALAEATRLWFGLILPLLFVAAAVEVYITPLLLGAAIGSQ